VQARIHHGSKSVRLDEAVYELFESRKRDGETFSEAIERLLSPPPLTDLAGILLDEEADEFRAVLDRGDELVLEDLDRLFERVETDG
jgi:predicted CopG family antitoxin